MILHQPELSRADGKLRVAARIETRHPKLAGLERLWFEVDSDRGVELGDRADPFLAAMIPVAMACGENVEVRGRTSPRLAWGIRELQHIHFAWWPRHLNVIDVRCETLEEAPLAQRGAGVACAFSGGVDSLYTTWRHTENREEIPGFRLSHALLVNGFDLDVDPEETGRFETLEAIYAPLLAPLGVALVTVRTNMREFRVAGVGRGRTIRSFGTALSACALALSPSLGRFYLAAARGYNDFHADGSNPSTDHLIGTAGFQCIHDGADVPTRFAKVAVIAAWPEALAKLRVCSNPGWQSVDPARGVIDNCGTCRKCTWTQTSLELITGRREFPGFRHARSRSSLRSAAQHNPHRAEENLHEALARGRRDIAFDIRCGSAQRVLEHWFRPILGHRRQRRARAAQVAPPVH
jgi:hypothetical protein